MRKLLLPVLIACLFGCQPTESSEQNPANGPILFHSTRLDGAFNLFLLFPENDSVVPVTSDTNWQYHPAWMPDHQSMLFTFSQGDSIVRVLRSVDGQKEKKHLEAWHPAEIFIPFPDGRGFVYQREKAGQNQIFYLDKDGKSEVQLTKSDSGSVEPHPSPDGRFILFRSNRDGNPELYRMNADGEDAIRITQNDSLDRYARWSPDGQKIAFASNRDGKDLDLYVMNADGSEVEQLTKNDVEDGELDWSPDGKYLVYHSRDSLGQMNMFTIEIATRRIRQHTFDKAYDGFGRWQ